MTAHRLVADGIVFLTPPGMTKHRLLYSAGIIRLLLRRARFGQQPGNAGHIL